MRSINSPSLWLWPRCGINHEDQPETNGRKIVVRVFSDRDISFAKLFAQKVTRAATPAIALVASTVDPPGLVFAQTRTAAAADMGALLKQVLSSVGGRGGGSRDFAQGGVPAGSACQRRAAFARGSGYNRSLKSGSSGQLR